MESARRWAPLAIAGAAVTLLIVVVAVALAADQPAAEKPQMVRFVSHFVAFAPKDPAILRNPDPAWFRAPSWVPSRKIVRTERGLPMDRPLADIAPGLGQLDAFKGRDPKAVADLAASLDSRWEYHVLTLSESGPMGHLLGSGYRTNPFRLRTAQGVQMAEFDNEQFTASRVVRVDRPVDARNAVWQAMLCLSGLGGGCCVGNTEDGAPGEIELGSPICQYAQSVVVRAYTGPAGGPAQEVVLPGIACIDTIELGAWDSWQPAACY